MVKLTTLLSPLAVLLLAQESAAAPFRSAHNHLHMRTLVHETSHSRPEGIAAVAARDRRIGAASAAAAVHMDAVKRAVAVERAAGSHEHGAAAMHKRLHSKRGKIKLYGHTHTHSQYSEMSEEPLGDAVKGEV
ncbi:uncharacterized protein E0L32_003880 [Thyridium curvatum]|uniref:Uncharacterized protein n=1 Tax=Thyridium curvatum TaxID=1093900 RepID=A0A507BBH2_9PEZI|nr:uncharacterized protein E0L32_003880 [Thyridium curvatum]TPX16586.1 hypothetical protein E0L32_003880 [Thyridium curvatum]